MRDYVIISDSSCSLEKDIRDKYDIQFVPMYFNVDEKDYEADLDWKVISAKDFYDLMREGKRITTAQVTSDGYTKVFTKALSEGKDVLYIGCTSALSASVIASYGVRDNLLKEYPEAKIICIDCPKSGHALGLISIHAAELKAEGKDILEVSKWVEENSNRTHQVGTVDKLTYLKQAGRVSAASAFFGGLFNVKPIIISDTKGHNAAIEKVKGRKVSINRMAEIFSENYLPVDYQKILICHADCLDDAKELEKEIIERLPKDGVKPEIIISYTGQIVGASTGPGMLGLYFFGKDITYTVD